jgi:hypothetical protein
MDFILSSPRSGSTWLAKTLNSLEHVMVAEYRLLGNHFDIQKNVHGRDVLRVTADAYIQSFINHYAPYTNLAKSELKHLLSQAYFHFISDFSEKISDKKIMIDKVTPYKGSVKKVLSKIDLYFAAAKIVHLVRDGRDVATSGIFDWLWREEPVLDRHKYYQTKIPGFLMKRFFDDESLRYWAEHWTESIISLSSSKHPKLLVKYEDLITDPASEIQKICDFLCIDASKNQIDSAISNNTFEIMTGRKRGEEDPSHKARKGIIGDWKRVFTKKDGAIFDQIAGEILKEYDYVDDRTWYLNLPSKLN